MIHILIEVRGGCVIGLKSTTWDIHIDIIDYDNPTYEKGYTLDAVMRWEELQAYIKQQTDELDKGSDEQQSDSSGETTSDIEDWWDRNHPENIAECFRLSRKR